MYLRKVDSEVQVNPRESLRESLDNFIPLVLLVTSSFHDEISSFSEGILVKLIEGLGLDSYTVAAAATRPTTSDKGDGEQASRQKSL